MAGEETDITDLLAAAQSGDKDAVNRLFEAVYRQLRALAHQRRVAWQGDETLNTTALVHEAYLKLVGKNGPNYGNRGHFFATASKAMRHILINHARAKQAAKRGGGKSPAPLPNIEFADDAAVEEIVSLDSALTRLEALSPRQARVVECRFFGGLDVASTAEALDISPSTVKRDWALAQAWLYREMGAG